MTGIDSEVMVHQLQVDPDYPLVKQKRCKFALKCNKVINEEIQRLINFRSIREVHYPGWLANIVIIHKKNEKG